MTTAIAPTTTGQAIHYLRELAGMSVDEVADAAGVAPWLLVAVESGERTMNPTWTGAVVAAIADSLSFTDEARRAAQVRRSKVAALIAADSAATFAEAIKGTSTDRGLGRNPDSWFELAARCRQHATASATFEGVAKLAAAGTEIHLRTGAVVTKGSGPVFAEFGTNERTPCWNNYIVIATDAGFHEIVVGLAELLDHDPEVGKPLRFGPPAAPCESWCTAHRSGSCNRTIATFQPTVAKGAVRVALQQSWWRDLPDRAPRVVVTGPTSRLTADERDWLAGLTAEAVTIEPRAVTR